MFRGLHLGCVLRCVAGAAFQPIMNLSHLNQRVERFGPRLLGIMVCYIPVIAPPIGVPVEFIENGYPLDSRNPEHLSKLILHPAKDAVLYERQSTSRLCRAKKLSPANFAVTLLIEILGQITPNDQ